MRYLGGKHRQGPKIAEYLRAHLSGADYIEPFCGALGAASAVIRASGAGLRRVRLSDSFRPIITMWRAIVYEGWVPPLVISEGDFLLLKEKQDPDDPMTAFAGFNVTFMSRYFSGYFGKLNGGDVSGAQRTTMKKAAALLSVADRLEMEQASYEQYTDVTDAVIYLDPPYRGTSTQYDGLVFDSDAMWRFARHLTRRNTVFVSEFEAPPDFEPVVNFGNTLTRGDADGVRRDITESLYRLRVDSKIIVDLAAVGSKECKDDDMRRTEICLIDWYAIWMWKWAATKSKPVGAAMDETRSTVNSIADRWPGATVICVDVGRSLRYDDYPGYKAGRPPRDPGCIEQSETLLTELNGSYPIVGVERYEGDDIIATLTRYIQTIDGLQVVIAGADKDLLCLLNDRVRLLHVHSRNMWGPAEVVSKFKVEARQMPDYLSLVGDKSDAIPGVPGVGDVNAARLLSELGDIPTILSMLDTKNATGEFVVGPQAIRDSILANRGELDLSIKLVQLRYDAPIDCKTILAGLDIEVQDDEESGEINETTETNENTATNEAPAVTDEAPPIQERMAPPNPAPALIPAAQRPAVSRPSEARGGEWAHASGRPWAPRLRQVQTDGRSPTIKMSATIGQLASALASAQAEFTVVAKDRTAKIRTKAGVEYSYDYATLGAVIAAVRPALAAHHIAILQPYSRGVLFTMLFHHSGEWMETEIDAKLNLGEPQAAGSLLSYLRRYMLSALLCVAPEDDDGSAAQEAGGGR